MSVQAVFPNFSLTCGHYAPCSQIFLKLLDLVDYDFKKSRTQVNPPSPPLYAECQFVGLPGNWDIRMLQRRAY